MIILWANLLEKNASVVNQLILLPIAFLFYDIFWDRDSETRNAKSMIAIFLYILSFAWIIYIGYSIYIGTIEWNDDIAGPMISFVMIVIFELFYMFDIIKGGADAKAVICLAILFPWYPSIVENLPLIVPNLNDVPTFFTFSLSVLFVAAIISVFMPFYFIIINIRSRNEISGKSFFGFKMSLDEVEKHFVWLIEWVENDRLKYSARKPRDSENLKEDLEALKSFGKKEVWVTYKIPFIIPLTIAIIIMLIIGNPLFLIY